MAGWRQRNCAWSDIKITFSAADTDEDENWSHEQTQRDENGSRCLCRIENDVELEKSPETTYTFENYAEAYEYYFQNHLTILEVEAKIALCLVLQLIG